MKLYQNRLSFTKKEHLVGCSFFGWVTEKRKGVGDEQPVKKEINNASKAQKKIADSQTLVEHQL